MIDRMLKLYRYHSFDIPRIQAHTATQAENQDGKEIPQVHADARRHKPTPGSLAPKEIGRATSIVTSRHMIARHDSLFDCPTHVIQFAASFEDPIS